MITSKIFIPLLLAMVFITCKKASENTGMPSYEPQEENES